MSDELWITVGDAPVYEVSNLGRVRRRVADALGRYQGHVIKQRELRGYKRVSLRLPDGTSYGPFVHRLVCAAFNGPCPADKEHCAHRDGDPANNVPDNLYWATALENADDRERHGRTRRGDAHWTRQSPDLIPRGRSHYRKAQGYRAPNGAAIQTCKLSEAEVVEIRATPEIRGTGKALAERYGVSMGLISAIRKGRIWRHLGQDRPASFSAASKLMA